MSVTIGERVPRDSVKTVVEHLLDRIRTEGEFLTPIPNLTLYRFDAPTNANGYLLEPSLCVVFQGSKHVILGENEQTWEEGSFFVTSIDLPLIARIVRASAALPYVGMVFKLDRMEVARLVMENALPSAKSRGAGRAIETGKVSRQMLSAVSRMIELMEEPECIPALAPLVQKEILFRLLNTECGLKIRQIAIGGSPTHQISRAIEWIKGNLRERLRIEALADKAGMSVSTLHHHFRSLTSLSPLQFQKRLRLNEARRLMLCDHLDAATTAFEVGYESPSQFSREYSRMFGAPPLRDIRSLTQE